MPRPRAEQINDQTTKFTRFVLETPISSPTLSIQGAPYYANFTNATLTQAAGGVEENCSAFLTSGQISPYTGLNNGDQISVTLPGVNGGSPIVVTFSSITDFITLGGSPVLTTAYAIARINTALTAAGVSVSSPVAQNVNGYLQFQSANGSGYTTGDTAAITITDITAGTLLKLGFGSVSTLTATGTSVPKHGVVTKSADNRGGFIPLRHTSGEQVMTRPSFLRTMSSSLGQGTVFIPDVPGGRTIYARLTNVPSIPAWRLNFFAQGFLPPTVITNKVSPTALTLSDNLTIDILDETNNVTFSFVSTFNAALTTVQDVVNVINTAWKNVSSSDKARVQSKIPEPYLFPSGPTVRFELNSSLNFVDVPFTGSSAIEARDSINTAITGGGYGAQATAIVHNWTYTSGGHYVEVSSLNTNFESSTLGFGSQGDLQLLERLGIAPGVYTGTSIAKVVNGTEIQISYPGRVPNPSTAAMMVLTASSPTTATRLGLPGTITSVSPVWGEEAVTPPASPESFIIAIPEVVEFGEIPRNYDSSFQKFLNTDIVPSTNPADGLRNADRPAILGSDGKIPADLIHQLFKFLGVDTLALGGRKLTTAIEAALARVSIPYRDSTSFTLLCEVPSSPAASPLLYSTIRLYSARDVFVLTVNAKWDGVGAGLWHKDLNSVRSTKFEITQESLKLFFHYTVASTWDDSSWTFTPLQIVPSGIGGNIDNELALGSNTILRHSGVLYLIDSNIGVLDSSGLALTGSVSTVKDDTLRVAGIQATTVSGLGTGYSIFRSLNARSEITCGDGTNSFGDFNGPGAITSALAFITANSLNGVTLHIKRGGYTLAGPLNFNNVVHVIGDNATVSGDGISIPIVIFTGASGSTFKGLTVDPVAAVSAVSASCDDFRFEDCFIYGDVRIFGGATRRATLIRCSITSSLNSSIFITGSGYGRLYVENCNISPGSGRPALLIESDSSAYTFVEHTFRDCTFTLSKTTVSGLNLASNPGLVELKPLTYDRRPGVATGAIIKRINFFNCTVDALNATNTGDVNTLLYLTPRGASTTPVASPSGYTWVDDLLFDNCTFTCILNQLGKANPFTVSTGYGNLVLRDCIFNFRQNSDVTSIHGSPLAASNYAFGGTLTETSWAALAINTSHVTIENLQLNGLAELSRSGDMTLFCNKMNIHTIDANYVTGGGGGAITLNGGRFYVRCLDGGILDGLTLYGKTALVADWVAGGENGYLRLEGYKYKVSNYQCNNFLNNAVAESNASGIFIGTSTLTTPSFIIEECKISSVRRGIFAVGDLGELKFVKNKIHDCSDQGIYINATSLSADVNFIENYIFDNGVHGIEASTNLNIGPSNEKCFWRLIGNDFSNNSGGSGLITQASFHGGIGAVTTYIIAYGNSFAHLSGSNTRGRLEVANGTISAPTAIASPVAYSDSVYGIETIQANTTTQFTYYHDLSLVPGESPAAMLMNRGLLLNGTVGA